MGIAYDHNWEASSQSVLILTFTQVAVSKHKGLLQTTQASQLTANAQTATAARIRKYALHRLAEAQANSQAPTQAPPDTEPALLGDASTQVRSEVACGDRPCQACVSKVSNPMNVGHVLLSLSCLQRHRCNQRLGVGHEFNALCMLKHVSWLEL